MNKRHDNPCRDCPNKGCGRQALCAEYMAFFNGNRERNAQQMKEKDVTAYITNSVNDVKRRKSPNPSWKRYRPKH